MQEARALAANRPPVMSVAGGARVGDWGKAELVWLTDINGYFVLPNASE